MFSALASAQVRYPSLGSMMGSLFSGIGSSKFSANSMPLPPNVESSITASLNVLTHRTSNLSAAILSTIEKPAGGTRKTSISDRAAASASQRSSER